MLGFCGGGGGWDKERLRRVPSVGAAAGLPLEPEAKEARSRRVMLTGGVPGYSVRAGGTRACCVRGEVP